MQNIKLLQIQRTREYKCKNKYKASTFEKYGKWENTKNTKISSISGNCWSKWLFNIFSGSFDKTILMHHKDKMVPMHDICRWMQMHPNVIFLSRTSISQPNFPYKYILIWLIHSISFAEAWYDPNSITIPCKKNFSKI